LGLSAGGLIIPRMINMNESGPKTIAQVEEFLSASALIEFNPCVDGPHGLVGVGGRQIGGVDLAIDEDEFFGPTATVTMVM
jgi:peptidase E